MTNNPQPGEAVIVYRGPTESRHLHAPNQEEVGAVRLTQTLKRKAADNPGQPPSQILRAELPLVIEGILSQLPEREALAKAMRRERRLRLPTNPRSLQELRELPEEFQRTLLDEKFLMYDSRDEDSEEEEGESEDSDAEERPPRDRVLVFSTRRNIELLCRSATWFLDGTFKTAPSLFTQIFAILGLRRRNTPGGEQLAVLFVYALLTRKTSDQYAKVLRAVQGAANEYGLIECDPGRFMTDFEKAILNACEDVYPNVEVNCCFFHFCQSMYRHIQELGLQVTNDNPDDRTLKTRVHMLLALAFIPIDDVRPMFRNLKTTWSEAYFKPVIQYFGRTYVLGAPAQRNRARVEPRYPPMVWNHYAAALNGDHRTNNVSEGWHSRFQVVVGNHHPDMYSALTELKREQADTETVISELAMGKKVKALPKHKWVVAQQRIMNVTSEYNDYKRDDKVVDYLRTLSPIIEL